MLRRRTARIARSTERAILRLAFGLVALLLERLVPSRAAMPSRRGGRG